MANENDTRTRRVLLDTNIFILAYSESASAEKRILESLSHHRAQLILLHSNELQDQILRVARRVGGKDWAGLLLFYLWRDFNIETISLDDAYTLLPQYEKQIPSEDLLIFFTAFLGHADYLVSRNRVLLRAALGQVPPFRCLTPEEFLNEVLENVK